MLKTLCNLIFGLVRDFQTNNGPVFAFLNARNINHEARVNGGEMSEETNKAHPLIQTYLRKKGFFVSTAYRESSAMLAPNLWYYETLVWAYVNATKQTGKLLYSEDSGSGENTAYKSHARIVEKLSSGESLEEV